MDFGLETITDEATMPFPWGLTIRQLRDLTDHISKKLQGTTSYRIVYSRKAGYEDGYVGFLSEERIDTYGKINLSNPPFLFDEFNLIYKKSDLTLIRGIQFQTKPNASIKDYRPEIVQMWKNTKKAIEDYFDENPESNRE